MILLALALPVAAAVLLARASWPPPADRGGAFRVLQACLASGCGLALSSCGFFLWYPFFGHPKNGYVAAEATVCLVLIGVAAWRLRRAALAAPPPAPVEPSWTRWLWVPFGVSALAAGRYLVAYFGREPHGDWDAFTIWNLRARLLFRTDADNWIDAFSWLIWHADYPLFLSATVARVWCYAGEDSPTAPMAVAALMLALAVGTLVAGLNYLRGGGQGWLAGAVLLASFPVVSAAGLQYADVPVAYFFLAAVAALAVCDRADQPTRVPAALAGAAAGFAAWTKNEGVLFLAVLAGCRIATHARRRTWGELRREALPFATGLLPAGLTLAVFKFAFAPPNDLVSGQGGGTVGRLLEWSRHVQVIRAVAEQVWAVGPYLVVFLAAYALLIGRPPAARRPRGGAHPWLVLAAVAAGYYCVYVTTPHDLSWHLATSLNRLIAQLWPLFLFALFMTVGTADERLGGRNERVSATPKLAPQVGARRVNATARIASDRPNGAVVSVRDIRAVWATRGVRVGGSRALPN